MTLSQLLLWTLAISLEAVACFHAYPIDFFNLNDASWSNGLAPSKLLNLLARVAFNARSFCVISIFNVRNHLCSRGIRWISSLPSVMLLNSLCFSHFVAVLYLGLLLYTPQLLRQRASSLLPIFLAIGLAFQQSWFAAVSWPLGLLAIGEVSFALRIFCFKVYFILESTIILIAVVHLQIAVFHDTSKQADASIRQRSVSISAEPEESKEQVLPLLRFALCGLHCAVRYCLLHVCLLDAC
mgnify:CR=1 FL=1